MDKTELKRIAAAQGLAKLSDKDVELFAQSIKTNARLVAGLPKDLHWSEESALILRLLLPKDGDR